MPAALPPAGAEDVLYLVDLSGYVFRAYHALPPLSNTRGEPTHAVLGTVNMLQKIIGERRPHMFGLGMDSVGRTFRHELDARYKATRPPPPPDLSAQMRRVEEIARAYDVAIFQQKGLEADDLIAAVTARAVGEGRRVVIVSSDKDLMQLVRDDDDRVVLWDTMRDKVYGPAEVEEKMGVRPSLVRDYLALTGDTSDNVPGVPSVGPKTAVDLLRQLGSIEGIYTRLEEVKRPKLRDTLRAHEDDARLSKKLVTLDATVAIDWQEDKLRWGGADIEALRRLFTELEFTRQLGQVEALAGPPKPGAAVAGAPHAAAATPVYDVIDLSGLDRVVAEARAGKQLGIAVVASDPDAMRGAIVGLALSTAPGKGHYLPVQHRYLGSPRPIPLDAVCTVLGPVLADAAVTKVGHELKQASIHLSRAGAPLGGAMFDTHVAAYL
ncbi:MAG: 5'-3' exonuclease H3TH domain-containing protein, partial [Polyangiaceae bacterium]